MSPGDLFADDSPEEDRAVPEPVATGPEPAASDPVASYLRAIGATPLLSREEEVALAKQIEEGDRLTTLTILANPWAREELGRVGDGIAAGSVRARDFFEHDPDLIEGGAPRAQHLSRALKKLARGSGGAADLAVLRPRRRMLEYLAAGIKARVRELGKRRSAAAMRRSCAELVKGEGMAGRARARLISANLRLVVSVAKRYMNRGLQLLDLVQEGNIGLMKGVERFDYTRGFKFATYATWWIRQSISRAVADQARTIRVPTHVNEQLARLARTASRLSTSRGHDATPDEIAGDMDLSADAVLRLLPLTRPPLSLDAPVADDDDSRIGDQVSDALAPSPIDATLAGEMAEKTQRLLSTLSPRDEKILRMRFGIGRDSESTLEEVGRVFNLTRERIRQIEAKALRKLRLNTNVHRLRPMVVDEGEAEGAKGRP